MQDARGDPGRGWVGKGASASFVGTLTEREHTLNAAGESALATA
jgi:hypothetical protein